MQCCVKLLPPAPPLIPLLCSVAGVGSGSGSSRSFILPNVSSELGGEANQSLVSYRRFQWCSGTWSSCSIKGRKNSPVKSLNKVFYLVIKDFHFCWCAELQLRRLAALNNCLLCEDIRRCKGFLWDYLGTGESHWSPTVPSPVFDPVPPLFLLWYPFNLEVFFVGLRISSPGATFSPLQE